MIKYIAFFSIISLLISCHGQPAKNNYAALIKGDWIGRVDTTENNLNLTSYISFEDSTCYGSFWSYSQYQILQDTLYINGLFEKDKNSQYTILRLTPDSLLLVATKHQDFIPDTVSASKIKAKNYILPSAVYFASSGCFGKCPVEYLEIDSSLHVKFYGERFTAITGGYSGTITRSQYNVILNKIRNIPLTSLKPYYDAPWSDDQTCGIAICNGDSVIKTAAYGHYREPMELFLVLGKLEYLFDPGVASLHADSTVTAEYFSTHSQYASINTIVFPPKVPAPTEFTAPKIEK